MVWGNKFRDVHQRLAGNRWLSFCINAFDWQTNGLGMTVKYDPTGDTWDVARWPDPLIVDRLMSLLDADPGAAVPDLACGTGNYAFVLAERGMKMTGVDVPKTMLTKAGATPKSAWNGHPRNPAHGALRGRQPAVLGCSGWKLSMPVRVLRSTTGRHAWGWFRRSGFCRVPDTSLVSTAITEFRGRRRSAHAAPARSMCPVDRSREGLLSSDRQACSGDRGTEDESTRRSPSSTTARNGLPVSLAWRLARASNSAWMSIVVFRNPYYPRTEYGRAIPWAAGRDTGSFATVHFASGHDA